MSACIGSPTLGSTCGRVFLSWRGRAVLETFCDLFAFLDDRRALGKAAFARSPVLPVSPRCPHRPRFLAGKNRKSGLARTNAFRYHISSRRGRGSAGRARPCQGRGRGFEPRRPLHETCSPAFDRRGFFASVALHLVELVVPAIRTGGKGLFIACEAYDIAAVLAAIRPFAGLVAGLVLHGRLLSARWLVPRYHAHGVCGLRFSNGYPSGRRRSLPGGASAMRGRPP